MLAVLLITGCTATQDDRICLDYEVTPVEREKCIPLYGNIICHNVLSTRVVCTEWMEVTEESVSKQDI